ncbi:MAG: tetratricopeptide repeat protein [Gemmatimonadota bacterium]
MSPLGTRSVRRAPARLLLALAGGALLALPACATKGDMRNLQMEMSGLEERQEEAFRTLERRLAMLLDSVELTLELQRNMQGQTANQARALGRDIQQLGNLVDDTQQRLQGLLQEFSRLDDLIERMEALARQGALRGGQPMSTPPPTGGSREAREYYDMGVDFLANEEYATARTAFREVVSGFPEDPWAPRAQLQVAETYVRQGRLEDDAYDAFEEVWERWPDAEVVPEALYRAGFVALEDGERRRARDYWQRLVREHPETDPARLAEEGLRTIGG